MKPLTLDEANLLPNARTFLELSARLSQLGNYSELAPDTLRTMLQQVEKPTFVLPALRDITEETIAVKDGHIKLRLYHPKGTAPFPVVVYYHGGGWVFGDLETTNEACHLLASNGLLVVSVDYRLAPEYPFPTPFNDSYAALLWVHEKLESLQGDPAKLFVAGDSAGGNLAAALAIRAQTDGPALAGQLLVYPATSMDYTNPSYTLFKEGFGLDTALVEWFYDHYTKAADAAKHPYAAPFYATDVSGVPRALLFSAENDVLRDEVEQYADKLRNAGIDVTHHFMPGLVHGYFSNYALFAADIEETVWKMVAFIKG